MHQIYPLESLGNILDLITAVGLTIRLFTNNLTPDHTAVFGSFTEASFTGYAGANVGSWSSSTTGLQASRLASPVSFHNTSGSPQAVYGYYITDTGNTKLYGAARFDSAPLNIDDGDFAYVTPTLSDFSKYDS